MDVPSFWVVQLFVLHTLHYRHTFNLVSFVADGWLKCMHFLTIMQFIFKTGIKVMLVFDTLNWVTRIKNCVLLFGTGVTHVRMILSTFAKRAHIVVYWRGPLVYAQALVLVAVLALRRECVYLIINFLIFVVLLLQVLIINLLTSFVMSNKRAIIATFRYTYYIHLFSNSSYLR